MPLVIGHSQVKYLSDYLSKDDYSVFSYPGYKTSQFLEEDIIFDVSPFYSIIVLVVGANDIGTISSERISASILDLCTAIHTSSPSSKILVSEVLPRGQNNFDGCQHPLHFIERWNHEAGAVNRNIHSYTFYHDWLDVMEQVEFHSLFGANRSLLSRDGLHLSFDGVQTITSNIESAVRASDSSTSPPSSSLPSPTSYPSTSPPSSSLPSPTSYPSTSPPSSSLPSPTSYPSTSPPSSSLPTPTSYPSTSPPSSSLTSPTSYPSTSPPSSSLPTPTSYPYTSPPSSSLPSPTSYPSMSPPSSSLPSPTSYPSTSPPSSSLPSPISYPSTSPPSSSLPSPTSYPSTSPPPSSVPSPLPVPSSRSTSIPKRSSKLHISTTSRRHQQILLIESDTRYYLSTDRVKLVGGGNEIPLFSKTDRVLTHHEAADILIQNLSNSVTYDAPYRPSEGSVFLYDDSGDLNKKEDWRADGYTWRQYGKKTYPTGEKEIERFFFKVSNRGVASGDFLKQAFRFSGNNYNSRTVVVYLGDSSIYKGLPHGNRKRNVRQYKRTHIAQCVPHHFDNRYIFYYRTMKGQLGFYFISQKLFIQSLFCKRVK